MANEYEEGALCQFFWGGDIVDDPAHGITYFPNEPKVMYEVPRKSTLGEVVDMLLPTFVENGGSVGFKLICRMPSLTAVGIKYHRLPINDDRTMRSVLGLTARAKLPISHVDIYIVMDTASVDAIPRSLPQPGSFTWLLRQESHTTHFQPTMLVPPQFASNVHHYGYDIYRNPIHMTGKYPCYHSPTPPSLPHMCHHTSNFSRDMRGGDRRAPPLGHSLATTLTKHKQSPVIEQSHHHGIKRRRHVTETEILTPISDTAQSQSSSNSFIPIRCSHQMHKRQKHKQEQRKSDTIGSHRKWVLSSRDFSSYKDTVVVISYNILGVENTLKHPDLYVKVPPKFLDWDWRKQLICKEINHYHPSILCFQEVDRFDDLDDRLQRDGFKGVFKARTGKACDGCALFWKDELFTLLHQENIEFHRFGLRDNVAQLCILKMNKNQSTADVNTQTSESPPTRSLLVGNIHVLYNQNRGDIKLGQVRLFLEKAHKLSQEWGNIPIVLAGDLNSMPQSAMYLFLASSELDIRLHDRRKISGQVESPLQCRAFGSQNKDAARFRMSISNPLMHRWSDGALRLATGSDGVTHLRHHLKLCSAYMGVPGSRRTRYNYGEPLATSYHSKFMGTVDYIWHSEKLVPMRVLETLPIDILKKTGGLPSERWGSDHLALACELAFVD